MRPHIVEKTIAILLQSIFPGIDRGSRKEHRCVVNKGKQIFVRQCRGAAHEEYYDGICEAAFPRCQQAESNEEYFGLLKPGGRVLINDFAIRQDAGKDLRDEVVHIPCFKAVQTLGKLLCNV